MVYASESIYQVEFNHHAYTLPVCPGAGGISLVKVDFIHNPYLMYDAAVEANRYMNHNISNHIDIIVTPECRCITLATQLAFMNGCQVIMLRKSLSADEEQRPFWSGTYQSRTHNRPEHLYLTEDKARMMAGKQVLVLDDVSSTGKTFIAIHNVLENVNVRASFFAIFDEDCEKDKQLATLPSYYFLKTLPVPDYSE